MGFVPVPSQAQIQAALRTMLLAILPSGIEVIQGQDNDVAEPSGDFVVMTVILRTRLGTNEDTYADCKFLGAITNGVLTVSSFRFGKLALGNVVFGTGAPIDPTITAINPDGTARLSSPITLPSSWLAAGAEILKQKTDVVVQLDAHSESIATASDYAQTIATVFRDDRGYQLLTASGFAISPLYVDDPRQIPFQNGENQTESRYVVTAHLQVDQVLTLPQQFAEEVEFKRLPADIFYHA